MAVERFFSAVKQDLTQRSAGLFEQGADLLRQGKTEEAEKVMEEVRALIIKSRGIDAVQREVVDRFNSLGIDQPSPELIEKVFEVQADQPKSGNEVDDKAQEASNEEEVVPWARTNKQSGSKELRRWDLVIVELPDGQKIQLAPLRARIVEAIKSGSEDEPVFSDQLVQSMYRDPAPIRSKTARLISNISNKINPALLPFNWRIANVNRPGSAKFAGYFLEKIEEGETLDESTIVEEETIFVAVATRRRKFLESSQTSKLKLPDGQEIEVVGKIKSDLLKVLLPTTVNNPLQTDSIATLLYGIDNPRTRDRVRKQVERLQIDLEPLDWKVTQPITPFERSRGVLGNYYLEKTVNSEPKEETQTEVEDENETAQADPERSPAKTLTQKFRHPKYTQGSEIIDFRHAKDNLDVAAFLENLPGEASRLVKAFLDTEESNWILTQARNFRTKSNREMTEFRNKFAGRIFEEIGYIWLNEQNKRKDLFLLSPEETLILYSSLYPQREVRNFDNHNLTFGIDGVSYPDGIWLRDSGDRLYIDGIVEYKSATRELGRFSRQLESYSYEKIHGDLFRQVVGQGLDASLIARIVNQSRSEIPIKPVLLNENLDVMYVVFRNSEINPENVTLEHLPVNSVIFGRAVDLLEQIAQGIPNGNPSR